MSEQALVWVVDDDPSMRWVLEKALQKNGFQVQGFASGEELLEALEASRPEVIVSDIRMPGLDGIALLSRIRAIDPGLPVIIMTAHSDLDSAVKAYDVGAFEYLPKPFDVNEAVDQVNRALASRQTAQGREPVIQEPEVGIIGKAPSMQEVFRAIGRLSRSNISVLITGESGTGKELVARALHQHSPRSAGPFIALNMAAIPRDLMEAELFGHEKGAFTGAQARRVGRFEQAEGGTLFLDEIGDMPADAQTRLLRVLSDGQFYRVGGGATVKADVRILAATHQDLEALVKEGRFREDLYHRLNVIRIDIPPLRERAEDIPQLMEFFLKKVAAELETETKEIRPDALQVLEAFPWQGNVRQLENVARWLTVMASGREIHASDLPPEIRGDAVAEGAAGSPADWRDALGRWVRERHAAGAAGLHREVEDELIRAALAATEGHKQEAAKLLGWGRNTLTRKLKDL
ncbi:MAG: nitrogen regulation protein NR(I) [Gammaproteobacteria bacterium]|nr:MAG: nitrogen regulation protein NR(I) [Gammaproteobacteria bacterium]RTZ73993.1 MAG: nitrogen regulation protein NR(I) [Gammaproteobacteria bacterium]RTZ80407.1 MAG: nitrogen regulation protein NR(I) [Gammaproteobacteria bacterium]